MAEQQAQLLPWGRFKLVSKDPADESDHLYFYRKTHRIGRNARRSDIILDKLFISSTHCVITFEDADEPDGEPTVMIQDLSRNGVYLNEVLVAASNSAVMENNITVHFTKPGLRTRSITPTVYKFELLQDGLTEENTRLRNARESATHPPVTQARSAAADVPVTQPDTVTTPAEVASSSSVVTSIIRPTQELVGQKRSVDETGFELDVTRNLSAVTDHEGALRTSSAFSASSSGSGSSAKKQRRGEEAADAGSGDDDLNTSARIQQSNQELRRELQETRSREVQLSKQLSDAELEILSLTDKLEKCEEHGKKLTEDLGHKQKELDERDELIVQLKQDKLVLEGKFADSVQALEAMDEKVKSQTSVILDLEKDKKALDVNLATVNGQLGSSLSKAAALGEKVRALEVEKRELSVAKLSVISGKKSLEDAKQDVQEKKGIMEERLAAALEVFETIHLQVLKGRTYGDGIPGFSENLQKIRHRRMSVDSMFVDQSLADGQRGLTDSSFGSSEQSQPTPVHSSDVNTHDPDESETIDQDAAAAEAPLPTLNPFVIGGHQVLQLQQRTSQGVNESETQQLPSTGQGEVQEDIPDQQQGDSEESAISVRSASKTPPAKPMQLHSAPKKQVVEQDDEEEDEAVVVVVPKVAAVGGDDDDTDEEVEKEQEDVEAADKEDNADEDDRTPAEETKEADGSDDDDDVVIVDVLTPAAATATDEAEEEEAEAADTKPDGDREVIAAEQEQIEASAEEEDDDDDDEDEPPVLSHSSTDQQQQRWLPTITHDESLNSQTNASEGAGIFDDVTQLSQ